MNEVKHIVEVRPEGMSEPREAFGARPAQPSVLEPTAVLLYNNEDGHYSQEFTDPEELDQFIDTLIAAREEAFGLVEPPTLHRIGWMGDAMLIFALLVGAAIVVAVAVAHGGLW